jgi:hypothetical protein
MRKKKQAVISAFTLEANLKRKVRSHLRKLGFTRSPDGALKPPSLAKEGIRALHQEQRRGRGSWQPFARVRLGSGADFGGLSAAPALSLPRAQCDERIEYHPVPSWSARSRE